ncbi:MAG: hypothetical protein PHI55_08390 [Burkholderiaceae bacterium]|nr:hypothetical protein [Burkholderiaceae bacterium]
MDIFLIAVFIATGVYLLNTQEQRKRIALLASHLGQYQIEKRMETLTEGYLRALGETDPQRQAQIWQLLRNTELQISEQFSRFAAGFAAVEEAEARVSRWAVPLPLATRLFPRATFDMRQALALHAQGIARQVADPAPASLRDHAFTLSAELFLMQHTCHWFCKSKAIATARMLARHQTPHAQLVASVSPETRRAYLALVQENS